MSAQQQSELDRLWSALDSANAAIHSLEMLVAKIGRQHAPTPDYRIGEPVKLVFDAQWPEVGQTEGPCSCEESVALRKQLRDVLDEAGISADVDEGRDPIDAARSLRRDLNTAQDEGVALRAEVSELQRRNYNQAASHHLPRAQDVAEIHSLKSQLATIRTATAEAYALPNRAKFREHAWRYLDMIRDELIEPTAFEPAAPKSLLMKPSTAPAPGCHCPPDRCGAPVIQGRQMPCRRGAVEP